MALLAFNEAIDAYDQERGSFISFSQTVIQRRLVKEFGVSRRLIERHRKYILAVAVLLSHDLPYLQQYVLERG